jgi:hypothetical protein
MQKNKSNRYSNNNAPKVEEIKKKTNYYSTRNLLERYDDSPSVSVGAAAAIGDTPHRDAPSYLLLN